jgi:hypothetical protein
MQSAAPLEPAQWSVLLPSCERPMRRMSLVIGDPVEFELFGNSDLLDRWRDGADDLLDLFRRAEDNMSCLTAMFAGLNRFEIDIPTPPAG